jgi:AraC-like DNA-binding protein
VHGAVRHDAVHLLQVYSNHSRPAVSPQELLYRSAQSRRLDVRPGARARRARQLRDAEKDQLVQRYLEVRKMREVAREFRLSRTTVAKLLADHGIDTSRSVAAERVSVAARLYGAGRSSAVIGRRLGFDNHTVLKALRGRGIGSLPCIRTQDPAD